MNIAHAITSPGLQRHAILVHQGAMAAVKALEWLAAEGFETIAINVDLERRCPVISIRTVGKCAWLKATYDGAPYTIRPGKFGYREIVFRVSILGCNVQWTEGGH